MELYPEWTEICVCHCCGAHLHWRPGKQNIYSGGPWACGRCGADVTEDIYGKKKPKQETHEPNTGR